MRLPCGAGKLGGIANQKEHGIDPGDSWKSLAGLAKFPKRGLRRYMFLFVREGKLRLKPSNLGSVYRCRLLLWTGAAMRKPLALTVIALLSLSLVVQAQRPAPQTTPRVVATAPSPAEELQLSLGPSMSGQPLDDPQCQVAWAGTPLCKTLELTLKNTGTHLLRVLNDGCTRPLINLERRR